MIENYHKDVARYRLERAAESLMTARQSYELGSYKNSVSQSFYCILTAIRALLALKHVDSHRQEGAITLFHQYYVKPKLFPQEFNAIIRKLKDLREEADYGDFVEITKATAAEEIAKAEKFLKTAQVVFARVISSENNNSSRSKNKNRHK